MNGFNPDFDLDLEYGEEGEARVKALWDGVADGSVTVETKTDRRAADTGNLYIEVEQKPRGDEDYKPSGIATSKADVWVYQIGPTKIVFDTVLLRNVARNHWKDRQDGGLGGDNPTRGVLLPLAQWVKEVEGEQ